MMDLAKTQFLLSEHGSVKAYRRKRATMLFAKSGKPIRLIEWQGWRKLKEDYPEYVEADGLTVRTVWTLVEVPVSPAD